MYSRPLLATTRSPDIWGGPSVAGPPSVTAPSLVAGVAVVVAFGTPFLLGLTVGVISDEGPPGAQAKETISGARAAITRRILRGRVLLTAISFRTRRVSAPKATCSGRARCSRRVV